MPGRFDNIFSEQPAQRPPGGRFDRIFEERSVQVQVQQQRPKQKEPIGPFGYASRFIKEFFPSFIKVGIPSTIGNAQRAISLIVGRDSAPLPAVPPQAQAVLEDAQGRLRETIYSPVSRFFGQSADKLLEMASLNEQERARMNENIVKYDGVKELLQNPDALGNIIGKSAPATIASMLFGRVGLGISGGKLLPGVIQAIGVTGLIEGGAAYERAIRDGATEEQAEKVAAITGVINAAIETFPATSFLRLLPSKSLARSSIVRKAGRVIGQAIAEGTTEAAQEIVANAAARVYKENPYLFAGAEEAFVVGALIGAPAGLVPTPASIVENAQKAETPAEAIDVMRNAGVPEELAQAFGEDMANAKTPEEVKEVFSKIEDAHIAYINQKTDLTEEQRQELVEDRGRLIYEATKFELEEEFIAAKEGTEPVSVAELSEIFNISRNVKTAAQTAFTKIVADGGVTIDPISGEQPSVGYVFSEMKEREFVTPIEKVTLEDVEGYIIDNLDVLQGDELMLGGWVEKGQVFLDASTVLLGKAEALRRARAADQIAIYDLASGETIYVKQEEGAVPQPQEPDAARGGEEDAGALEAGARAPAEEAQVVQREIASEGRSLEEIGTPENRTSAVESLVRQIESFESQVSEWKSLPSAKTLKITPSSRKNLDLKRESRAILRLYRTLRESATEFVNITSRIAGENPVSFTLLEPNEILARVARRRNSNKRFTATHIKDALVATIITDDYTAPFRRAQRHDSVSRTTDFFAKPRETGYVGAHATVELSNAGVSEIQIHTPRSFRAARAIQPILDKYRNFKSVPIAAINEAQRVHSEIMAGREAEPDPRFTGKRPRIQREPVDVGEGELRQRGRAKRAIDIAIREGVLKSSQRTLGKIPEYRQLNLQEQAAKAKQFIEQDRQAAIEVALGRRRAPEGIHEDMIYNAVFADALARQDVDTIVRLATKSDLNAYTTEAAQRLRIARELEPNSAIWAIQTISEKQREAAEIRARGKLSEAKAREMKRLKEIIEKAVSDPKEWDGFIDDITC